MGSRGAARRVLDRGDDQNYTPGHFIPGVVGWGGAGNPVTI